ncbi:hypothetical protein LZZ85_09180 [Terrimonas sp. NA20]|uniref:6-bladed beta-propeller n=1 Tax=Terrimonas ginsenosidimutans TaxID=2908004 RepID=A0ABS9KQ44_9BACT|nr:hypothetical protein [Terrimonas ginsenosidimutans]MCG2614452.1 hypothetical protein [Terrimonas ginsenosidimutans]
MRKLILLYVLLFATFVSMAQTDSAFRYIRSVKGEIAAFTVDNLDNIYLLGTTNQIKKLNSNGDSVAVYNNVKRYGQATLIDVSNPLKILLYYRDFATIVMLDRFLNEVNTIDLRRQNIFQAKAIGQSFDNKVWVYDEVENKLKKVDEDGKILQETPDFRQLFNSAPSPQKIFDQERYVYLYDSAQAVFVFDYYGTLKNKILIEGWKNFKVAGKYIYGSKENKLVRYDISSLKVDEWNLPDQLRTARSFNFSGTRLYTLQKDGIDIYEFQ